MPKNLISYEQQSVVLHQIMSLLRERGWDVTKPGTRSVLFIRLRSVREDMASDDPIDATVQVEHYSWRTYPLLVVAPTARVFSVRTGSRASKFRLGMGSDDKLIIPPEIVVKICARLAEWRALSEAMDERERLLADRDRQYELALIGELGLQPIDLPLIRELGITKLLNGRFAIKSMVLSLPAIRYLLDHAARAMRMTKDSACPTPNSIV